MTVEHARRRRRAEERTELLASFSALTRLITSATESDAVFRGIAEAATVLLRAKMAWVWVDDPASETLREGGSFGAGAEYTRMMREVVPLPRGRGLAGAILESRQAEYIEHVQRDPRFLGQRLAAAADLHACAAIPLIQRERPLGALVVLFGRRAPFTAEEKELVGLLADQATIAIENARLLEETDRRRREAEVVAELARGISASLDLDTVLQRLTDGAKDLVGSDMAMIGFREGDAEAITVRYRVGSRYAPNRTFSIEPGKGFGGQALVTGRPCRTDDYAADPAFGKDYLGAIRRDGAVAAMVVPIKPDDRVVGVLYVANRSRRRFTDHDESVLLRLADGAASAIKNAQLFARELESERRYRWLVEGSIQGVTILRDWVTLFANLALAKILGYGSPRELVGLDARCWIAPHEVARVETYAAARRRGEPVASRFEFQALRKDGALIWAEVEVSPVVWEGGPAVQITGFDVTERKRAEAALRDSSEFQKQIIASARSGVVVYDRELRYLVWNPLMEELTGLRAESVIGKHCLDLFPFLRERGVYELLERARAGETITSPDFRYTIPSTGKGGWVSGRYGPLLDANGTIIGVIATVRDVTDRRHAEEARHQSEEQLREAQKMEAVGQLAGRIAHDFNNLLAVITGRSDLLLRRLAAEDPARRDVELVKKTADRAATLTKQLLAFSRKQMLRPEVLDLNRIIAGVVQMLQRLIGENIDLVTLLDPNLGFVRADPAQIEQIVLNLAVNARDAMPQGGRLSIETASVDLDDTFADANPGAAAGPYVRFQVRDTGSGMSPEVQARIFEPFFTTKEIGKGTGLGLAIVYGIIKQHEGLVTVESAPGAGTTFRVYLKQVPGAADRGRLPRPGSAEKPW
jgi:PAS domain S-box-containing protein